MRLLSTSVTFRFAASVRRMPVAYKVISMAQCISEPEASMSRAISSWLRTIGNPCSSFGNGM